MIKKPTIIITSIGRTGTKFFQALFEQILPDATSLHEPDFFKVVRYRGTKERGRQISKQIREVGADNLILLKALGQWSLVRLSDARLRGELGYSKAVQQVLSQRRGFVHSRSGTVYIESSLAYYGLIDVLKGVYERHRVVYIIRDGHDWVQSWLNWGEMHGISGGMYGKGKIGKIFGHNWPKASEIASDPYRQEWVSMSEFEKLCWAWFKLNAYAFDTVLENPNARVFRFEDIFQSKDRYQHLADLVQFVTTFPDIGSVSAGPLEGWLDSQVYKSAGRFPPKEKWSKEQKRQFRTMCGPLMEKLGYDLD